MYALFKECKSTYLEDKGFYNEIQDDYDYDDEAYKIENIPIHAFDFIIADECHRGYTSGEQSKWREVLNYFDAIKIGLTATPAKHTTAYFKRHCILLSCSKRPFKKDIG